ncbi:hypothetical protein PT974_04939 [Cladobotryum mycophilum]|uniref:Uncharacterized protein n=1 Tax=Cladobotryum mycophilum TaxID=491253 RepID=A0ABR0SQK8_9HYPO
MAQDTRVCLGVAVDHRIRRLCKPVSPTQDSPKSSNHVSCIERWGQLLNVPDYEIQVIAQLAGPAVKGGIAIVLQQPRKNHPFEDGLDAVIEDCKTLSSLCDIFATVSCGTLDLRTDISVVDLLPYIPDKVTTINDVTLKDSFRTSVQAVCDKEPDVLLCAGQIWTKKFDDRKGDSNKIESIGPGKKFGSTPKLPVRARIRHGDKGLVTIPRVNGFHPSYAINYNPHASVLRQLLILTAAETCGMLLDH